MRVAASIAAALAATLALTGCGSDRTDRAEESLPAAAAKSLAAGSYHYDVTVEFRSERRKIVGHGHGAGDSTSMRQTVRYPPVAGQPMVSTYIVDARVGHLHTYVDNPAPEMAGGKHWLRFDLLPTLHRFGVKPSDVPGLGLASPASFLATVRSFHGTVMRLGPTTIDGEETTHFRVHLGDEDIVATAPPDKRAAVRRFLGEGRHMNLKADVWVGDDGLVRRLRQTVRDRSPTVTTLTFHDWGDPFTLRLPPPHDVADGNKLGR